MWPRVLSLVSRVCMSETCSFPTIPWENNHYGHFGNPALEAFSCNISSAGDFDFTPSCELIDVATENVKGAEPTKTPLQQCPKIWHRQPLHLAVYLCPCQGEQYGVW